MLANSDPDLHHNTDKYWSMISNAYWKNDKSLHKHKVSKSKKERTKF